MRDFEDCIKRGKDCSYVRVKVAPNSSRQEIYDIMSDDTVKIRLKSSPEKGRANKELVGFIVNKLGIGKDKCVIVGGHTDRTKLLRIDF